MTEDQPSNPASVPAASAATPVTLGPESRPRLPRGVRLKHDAVRDTWVLLAPERLLKLDPVALEILRRCSGEVTLAAIVDDLAGAFNAPRERIESDVRAMLADLVGKRMVDA